MWGSGSRAACAACRCVRIYEDDSPDGSDTPSETDGSGSESPERMQYGVGYMLGTGRVQAQTDRMDKGCGT